MTPAPLALPTPPLPRPQRTRRTAPPLDPLSVAWARMRHALAGGRFAPHRRASQRIRSLIATLAAAGALDPHTLRQRLRAADAADARCLALAGAALALQRTLGFAAYDVQLAAAHALLCGVLAEMDTGEGKTVVVALAAAGGALTGEPVHVMTANDYLVARDAAQMRPLFAALGLRVATVCTGDAAPARQAAYRADICYVTARELVFDYLRDAVRAPQEGQPLIDRTRAFVRPDGAARSVHTLAMALVDEADSVFIDDARVPLVLARARPDAPDAATLRAALDAARTLVAGIHFEHDPAHPQITLTAAGKAALGAPSRQRAARTEQALCALHAYRRDRDYVVRDAAVQIVDPHTGRIADGRAWSQELHRFIELKEGCPLGTETVTAAQITYQNFFPRYRHLAGISGTLREARGELAAIYDRPVVRIPRHRPLCRTVHAPRVFATREAMWRAGVARAAALAAAGRAVLIGTDSVADSRALAAHFAAAGQPHQVLDALHDADEATLVAAAGQPGRITVATRMAGRGTDIPLAPAVRAAGGLHVICCQHNRSARVDRQLIGRGARQDDPGSAERFIALDAAPLSAALAPWLRRALQRIPARALAALCAAHQRHLDIHDRRLRMLMLRAERDQSRRNAFRGTGV